MAYCKQNLTIGIYTVEGSGLLELENNRITGLIGRQYDRFLTGFGSTGRNCIFRLAFFFNERLESIEKAIQNISATHLMRANQLDFHSVPQELSYATGELEMSKIITISSYQVGHLIRPDKFENANYLQFFYSNITLILLVLIGYGLMKLAVYAFLRIRATRKFGFFKLFLINHTQRARLCSKAGLVLTFFCFFVFFLSALMINSLNTHQIIINTDRIIDSIDKLNETDKILTFYEDQSQILVEAPEGSFLHQLYNKKKRRKNEIYMISSKTYSKIMEFYSAFLKNGLTNHILFMGKIQLLASMRLLTTYTSNHFLFIKSTPFYENLNAYFLRRNLDAKNKKSLLRRINQSLENGLYADQLKRINDDLKSSIKSELKVFETLQEYYDEYSSVSGVHLENFRRIFVYYAGLLIVVFFTFIVHKIYKYIKRNLIRIKYLYF